MMREKPVYVVKLSGVCCEDELSAVRLRAKQMLDGTVVVVDDRVEYIEQLNETEKSRLVHMLASELGLEEK